MKNLNTDNPYTHVMPLFWPILWLNILLLNKWHSANAGTFSAIEVETTNFGHIRITKIYPPTDHTIEHMRAYAACTKDWCLDQLGNIAHQFARANRVRLHTMCGLLRETIQREPLAQPPLEPG